MIAALAVGVGLAFCNDRIMRYFLKKKANGMAAATMIRQLINILFLVGLYLLGSFTPMHLVGLMIGGALGLTIPLFFFTARLLNPKNSENGEEADKNG